MKNLELIGKRFGRLTVVEYRGELKKYRPYYFCVCDCGGNKIASKYSLLYGDTKSCGCLQFHNIHKRDLEIKIGDKFGILTVVGPSDKKRHNRPAVLCLCECGNNKIVSRKDLNSGNIKSCGCLRVKHGKYQSSTYRSWRAMLNRCYRAKTMHYDRYGGSGIKVCDRWREGFRNFLFDMGDRPAGTTLDRIDSSGNYCPENCRWASPKTQAHNRRSSVPLAYKGKTQCLAAWAREYNISPIALARRLKSGWDLETALTKPSQRSRNG